MNKYLEKFARDALKKDLAQCTTEQQHRFKQMYAKGMLGMPIDNVVTNMYIDRLDCAMMQVKRTLEKKIVP